MATISTSDSTLAHLHGTEVKKGARYEFGKNWSRFLRTLTPERIELAKASLVDYLELERFDSKTFLDVGSGSGLFSLAARLLGARVHSFDYDPNSVACTRELRRRYFSGDDIWNVEHASVLDRDFLSSLGQFDIVYSWGVLHHTGQMWQALENVKELVRSNGKLFIAIYNDLGAETDRWAAIKEQYNSYSRTIAFLYAQSIVLRSLFDGHKWAAVSTARFGSWRDWYRHWRNYDKSSTRGMSCWHDTMDWIGGHPYERATVGEIVDFYSRDGFRLVKLGDLSDGTGCNQFVFRRAAPLGVYVDNRIPGGASMARGFGYRTASGPKYIECRGWVAATPEMEGVPIGYPLYLVRDEKLVRPVTYAPGQIIEIAPVGEGRDSIDAAVFDLVPSITHTMTGPFAHVRGNMWEFPIPELAECGDSGDKPRRSPLYVFEDGQQLAKPHSFHDDIANLGVGRFSHWGNYIYFATSDNSDPNTNGRSYLALQAGVNAAR